MRASGQNTLHLWGTISYYSPIRIHSQDLCGARQLPYQEDLRAAEFATYAGVKFQEQTEAVDKLMSAMDMTSGVHAFLVSAFACWVCARQAIYYLRWVIWITGVQHTVFISLPFSSDVQQFLSVSV